MNGKQLDGPVFRLMLALASLLMMLTAAIGVATAQEQITVTDLAGRTVEVPHGAKRVILGEGRMFYATVVLDKDSPFDQIAAIGDDLPKYDPDTWHKYLDRFPEAKDVPMIGAAASSDFSVEKALELDVDVLIVTLGFYDCSDVSSARKRKHRRSPIITWHRCGAFIT